MELLGPAAFVGAKLVAPTVRRGGEVPPPPGQFSCDNGPATPNVGMSSCNAADRVADIKGNVCATPRNPDLQAYTLGLEAAPVIYLLEFVLRAYVAISKWAAPRASSPRGPWHHRRTGDFCGIRRAGRHRQWKRMFTLTS